MPIYHFEEETQKPKICRSRRISFRQLEDAWEEVTKAAAEMLKNLDGQFVAGSSCSIEVQDEFFNWIRMLNITVSGPKR